MIYQAKPGQTFEHWHRTHGLPLYPRRRYLSPDKASRLFNVPLPATLQLVQQHPAFFAFLPEDAQLIIHPDAVVRHLVSLYRRLIRNELSMYIPLSEDSALEKFRNSAPGEAGRGASEHLRPRKGASLLEKP